MKHAETIETVWPDDSFAQFGGHVLEQLFRTRDAMTALRDKRFRVRVTIEIEPITEPRAADTAVTVTTEEQSVRG